MLNFDIPATVCNVARAQPEVYIGRNRSMGGALLGAGGWGNPFVVGRDGDRDAVIERYRRMLWRLLEDEAASGDQRLLVALAALHGKRLGCHCAPQPCHGDVLVRAAAWAQTTGVRP